MSAKKIRYCHRIYSNITEYCLENASEPENKEKDIEKDKYLKKSLFREIHKIRKKYGYHPLLIKTRFVNNCILGYVYFKKALPHRTLLLTTPVLEGEYTNKKDIMLVKTKNNTTYIVIETSYF